MLDLYPFVRIHFCLFKVYRGSPRFRAGVGKKYGFGPERMIDYLALMGDKVDNIPGVPGVGEKTALALIQGLGGLDDIYGRLDEIAGLTFRGAKNMAAKLAEHRESAYMSYQLATIKLDVALDLGVQEYQTEAADKDALLALFEQFQFRSWIRDLTDGASPTASPTASARPEPVSAVLPELVVPSACDYRVVEHLDELAAIIASAEQTRQLAYLPVLAKGHYRDPVWIGLALATEPGRAWYLPFSAEDQPALPAVLLLPELGCINVWVRGLIEVNTTTTAAIAIGTTSTTSCKKNALLCVLRFALRCSVVYVELLCLFFCFAFLCFLRFAVCCSAFLLFVFCFGLLFSCCWCLHRLCFAFLIFTFCFACLRFALLCSHILVFYSALLWFAVLLCGAVLLLLLLLHFALLRFALLCFLLC